MKPCDSVPQIEIAVAFNATAEITPQSIADNAMKDPVLISPFMESQLVKSRSSGRKLAPDEVHGRRYTKNGRSYTI
jgi:hypothetical protein